MTAEELATKIRRAKNGAEFEFAGHLLLVLDYEDGSDRQVKVSPHPSDMDRDATWLPVDEYLADELKSLGYGGTG
jgi:hypothetical protein